MKEMYLIRPDGKTYRGADAARYLSLRLPRLWWLAPILNFPFMMPVWRWCYRWIAKRRYRMNKHQTGEDCGDSCSVHFGDK
jgi:predicted DCC family thiol-disulfide oxidoreductase YuxK